MGLFDAYAASKIGPTGNFAIPASSSSAKNLLSSFLGLSPASTPAGIQIIEFPILLVIRGTVNCFVRQSKSAASSGSDAIAAGTSDFFLRANVYFPLLVEDEDDAGFAVRGNGTAGTIYLTLVSQTVDKATAAL